MKSPQQIVKEGYNKLSTAYRAYYACSHDKHYHAWLDSFLQYIPQGNKILELGCGDGIPVAQYVSKHYPYLGIDISPVQIQLARHNVSEACFEIADMTEVSFAAGTFGGIIALYSMIHVPLQQQPALIDAMYHWLAVDGCLLVTVGAGAWTGTEDDWLLPGTTMYWSHADTETYIRWFSSAGFTIVDTTFVPEGAAGHTLLIVKKTGSSI